MLTYWHNLDVFVRLMACIRPSILKPAGGMCKYRILTVFFYSEISNEIFKPWVVDCRSEVSGETSHEGCWAARSASRPRTITAATDAAVAETGRRWRSRHRSDDTIVLVCLEVELGRLQLVPDGQTRNRRWRSDHTPRSISNFVPSTGAKYCDERVCMSACLLLSARKSQLEDGLRSPSVDVDAFATSTACYDLDLWPLFYKIKKSSVWDIVVTRCVQKNGRTRWADSPKT